MICDACHCNTQCSENFKFISEGNIHIMWYPSSFSQSRLGNENSEGSNACTIIVLLIATNIRNSNVRVQCLFSSPTKETLINLFSKAILEGNAIHRNLFKAGLLRNVNLTVPEAMAASKSSLGTMSEWKSSVYFNDIKKNLYREMDRHIIEWYKNPPCCDNKSLYMVLIAHSKSVLFVLQLDMNCVLLIDSHQHAPYGAVMSQVRISKLEKLCLWYTEMLCSAIGTKPEAYELSFLYFKCDTRNS
ncbi:uncharacterized protein LOC126898607 [Daktulosphaira vitifoliae]|uniref:uncharacterized protein LOC126898607 n=1 Tax=Daktulosphaira vitifoliae TaxID=58002 RepID=UPI0021AA38B0|nr:uncharacterized protein LOC126898607 [Daktulosphaira vitifoliae]